MRSKNFDDIVKYLDGLDAKSKEFLFKYALQGFIKDEIKLILDTLIDDRALTQQELKRWKENILNQY